MYLIVTEKLSAPTLDRYRRGHIDTIHKLNIVESAKFCGTNSKEVRFGVNACDTEYIGFLHNPIIPKN